MGDLWHRIEEVANQVPGVAFLSAGVHENITGMTERREAALERGEEVILRHQTAPTLRSTA